MFRTRPTAWHLPAPVLALLALFGLGGCADTGYLMQSVQGHWQVMRAAKPVGDWLQDPQTPPALKARLELTQRLRDYASAELHLPDNASYRRYGDLQRRAVVWNVVAAPAYSLTPQTWCFPVAGCVSYRGYFDQAAAQAQAQSLMAQGLETDVYGVPAYSTLGWTNLLGGDPLLNTFVNYPEGELARMIFHELAHQAVYVQGDTVFNESFATAVERLGAQRWLAQHASPAAQAEYALGNQRRSQFQALTRATRQTLLGIYAQYPQGQAPAPALKQQALDDFRASYAQLKAQWGGFAGYDAWVQRANNASFAAVSAYDELVPGFEALFEHVGQSWPKFYDAVQALARLPLSERSTALKTKHFTETSGG